MWSEAVFSGGVVVPLTTAHHCCAGHYYGYKCHYFTPGHLGIANALRNTYLELLCNCSFLQNRKQFLIDINLHELYVLPYAMDVHYTMYLKHGTLYIVHCTVYTVHTYNI